MNPNDYYRLKSAAIKEADIRLVAACMSDHVGEENAVRLEALVKRCGLGERWHVANELLSRENELRARRRIIELAHLPAKLELENRAPQLGLF